MNRFFIHVELNDKKHVLNKGKDYISQVFLFLFLYFGGGGIEIMNCFKNGRVKETA